MVSSPPSTICFHLSNIRAALLINLYGDYGLIELHVRHLGSATYPTILNRLLLTRIPPPGHFSSSISHQLVRIVANSWAGSELFVSEPYKDDNNNNDKDNNNNNDDDDDSNKLRQRQQPHAFYEEIRHL